MTLLQPGTVIPPGAHLLGNGATVIDPDVLLRAVRETATIVRPGETLIIRLPMAMPDPVFAQYAQGVMQGLEKAGVRAVVLRADQLAVAEALRRTGRSRIRRPSTAPHTSQGSPSDPAARFRGDHRSGSHS